MFDLKTAPACKCFKTYPPTPADARGSAPGNKTSNDKQWPVASSLYIYIYICIYPPTPADARGSAPGNNTFDSCFGLLPLQGFQKGRWALFGLDFGAVPSFRATVFPRPGGCVFSLVSDYYRSRRSSRRSKAKTSKFSRTSSRSSSSSSSSSISRRQHQHHQQQQQLQYSSRNSKNSCNSSAADACTTTNSSSCKIVLRGSTPPAAAAGAAAAASSSSSSSRSSPGAACFWRSFHPSVAWCFGVAKGVF